MDDLLSNDVTVVASTIDPPDQPALAFNRNNLGEVCSLVRAAAVSADITPRDLDDLLIAVSEIATHATHYGDGTGSITVRRLRGGLLAEISGRGTGLLDLLATERPSPGNPDGHGLWLARVLCRHLEVRSHANGVTVTVFTPERRTR